MIVVILGLSLFGPAQALEVQSDSLTIDVGKSTKVVVSEVSGKVSAKSTNSKIAKISYAKGVATVKGVKAGSAQIVLKDKKSAQTLNVTIAALPVLTLSPTALELNVGGTGSINVSNASGTVRASSSNQSVATVTYTNGIATIKGVKTGTATITIRDSKTSKQAGVTVNAPTTSTLSVSPTNISMNVGGSANITISNANGGVSVETGDASIATVSYANGIATVTGIKAGSTTVKVKDSKTEKSVAVAVLGNATTGSYSLMAWNDLGMHCMDGTDFSVFSILPPYNTLHAQLKDKSGKLVTSNVILTYEAVADSTGSINTSSANKTNFWSWVDDLFGLNPTPDVGVNLDGLATGHPMAGNKTPSSTPEPMTYNAAFGWFEAEGIPVTPFDDTGKKNFYPMVKVVAKDAVSRKVLASITTTLPVSDEMTCKGCHTSIEVGNPAQTNAKPAGGWVFDNDPEKDWKRNILKLHDQKHTGDSLYQSALVQLEQFGYSRSGLLPTADDNHKPVLCVLCHASNAYYDKENKTSVMGGISGIKPFTQALHLKHASNTVLDPVSQTPLNSIDNRESCYQCHPGSKTQCLRGAMGKAVDSQGNSLMSCQSCHGDLKAVGSATRKGWFEEPTCESCHNSAADKRRATTGVDANGKSIVPADHTFATNPDTPVPGLNLYRFSKGHGGLQCEACHGSTHAEYPSSHADENLQSIALQGHAGPVAECTACHATVPNTVNGGPHGMHTTGNAWVEQHEHADKSSCSYCHGDSKEGTPLSEIKVDKTINAGEFGIKSWPAGYRVSCFSCHNGPNPN